MTARADRLQKRQEASLGLTSFAGPIAHIGYFRAEFVARRRWLSETAYADLVALVLRRVPPLGGALQVQW